MSFDKALPLLVGGIGTLEGPWLLHDNPKDSGGATYGGITRRSYEASGHAWPPTPPDGATWYRLTFWEKYRCGDIPEPADAVFFQLVVNLPTYARIPCLQAALLVAPDGNWGPKTDLALARCDRLELADALLTAQAMHYANVADPADWDWVGLFDRITKVQKWLATVG